MVRTKQTGWEQVRRVAAPAVLAAALLLSGLGRGALVAATPLSLASPTVAGAAQQEAPETPAEFGVLLAQRMADRDFVALADLTAPEMRLVTWLGQRRVVDAEEVVQDFAEFYLGQAEEPYLDTESSLFDYFGVEPEILWGREWPVKQVLFLRGLGAEGVTDALLAIIEEEGELRWGGVLLATAGFDIALPDAPILLSEYGGPPASSAPDATATPEATPTSEATDAPDAAPSAALTETAVVTVTAEITAPTEAQVRILRTTNVYAEPLFDVPPVGLVRSGVQVPLLEPSADGEYLRVACPPALEDPCWVVNDPAAVEVVGAATGDDGAPALGASALGASALGASPAGEATPTPTLDDEGVELIEVGDGAFSLTRTGTVTAASPVRFHMLLELGQLLYVNVVSAENLADFSLEGLANGQVYKRIVNENRSLSFVVPVTQVYEIRIEAPEDEAGPIDFTLNVVALPSASQVGRTEPITPALTLVAPATPTVEATTVPTEAPTALPTERPTPAATATPTPAPTPTELPTQVPAELLPDVPGATRLIIEPGETSTALTTIVAPQGTDRYVLRALEGQVAYVTVESTNTFADFILIQPNGDWLKGLDGRAAWSGTLPESGDYLIDVVNSRRVRVQYTIYVTIEPLE
jgi:hypothetical protein